ncbi:MAG: trehalose-binding protein [Desulfobacteraceae bacterium]|nr:MAG: trehalose-binding protein [Desulfobacteraceae bacterium]
MSEASYKDAAALDRSGTWTFDEFADAVTRFHGYPAPGVLMGFHMVEAAKRRLPQGVLYDAICETSWCLPDAVQMLTPCTVGNGWLRILYLGLYAVSLFDKYTGRGVRVYLDTEKLAQWDAVADWYLKRRPKHEQRSDRVREQIRSEGHRMFSLEPIQVRADHLVKRSKGPIRVCPRCGEAYPAKHGETCRQCGGASPYENRTTVGRCAVDPPLLEPVPLENAVGRKLLHDLTCILPGESKGAAFLRGQTVTAGDLCRLQQMGRNRLYVEGPSSRPENCVHEDLAAEAFARAMAGEGTRAEGPPREGKVNILAESPGLLMVDKDRLERFNLVPDVMAASRKNFSIVDRGSVVAGTRAIPLFLSGGHFRAALALLEDGPLFSVRPMRPAKVGILVTGTEVFQGLVQDKFEAIITAKVRAYGCTPVRTIVVPDERSAIAAAIGQLLEAGSELIVTTAGLSVDPDDVTRKGLEDAGAVDMRYGAAVLPGAMTLVAHIGNVPVIGVPACALYFKTTSLDILLPRILAGVPIGREELAALGHGGLCLNCETCRFPRCPFGK